MTIFIWITVTGILMLFVAMNIIGSMRRDSAEQRIARVKAEQTSESHESAVAAKPQRSPTLRHETASFAK